MALYRENTAITLGFDSTNGNKGKRRVGAKELGRIYEQIISVLPQIQVDRVPMASQKICIISTQT